MTPTLETPQEWAAKVKAASEQETPEDESQQDDWLAGLPELFAPPTQPGEVQATFVIPKPSTSE